MAELYDDSYINLENIPIRKERPDSLENQLKDVIKMCNQSGTWKAADFIQIILDKELWKI